MNRALLPLVPVYAAAIRAKNFGYERGWTRPRRLQFPVVSVGNLSVGGSGKTPLVIRLAQLLRESRIAVDVLSRGYGRHSGATERVESGGSAEQFGDEPLLISRAAHVPVYVGANRYAAGTLAESQSSGRVLHLLDDGFQHRRLVRDLDIVVLHSSDFRSCLLPAGRLREGFSSLRRAQIIALREEDRELERELRERGWHKPVWWMERRIGWAGPRRVVAFCAIARPEEFFSSLRREGAELLAVRAWRDHHPFAQADLAELMELCRQHEAEGFVTTEKDLVRLSPDQQRILRSAAPLHAAGLTVHLHDEATAVRQLLALLPAEPGPHR